LSKKAPAKRKTSKRGAKKAAAKDEVEEEEEKEVEASEEVKSLDNNFVFSAPAPALTEGEKSPPRKVSS